MALTCLDAPYPSSSYSSSARWSSASCDVRLRGRVTWKISTGCSARGEYVESDLRGLGIGGRVWKGSHEFSSLMVVLTSASPAVAARFVTRTKSH